MGSDDLNAEFRLAMAMADVARHHAMRGWVGPGEQAYKSDGSVITETDLQIERIWRQMIPNAFPDHGILGEEYGAEALNASHVWVLDPIDGTRAFAAGQFNFASLIALCRDGIPVLGVMEFPATRHRYVGRLGQDSTLNGTPIDVAPMQDLHHARINLPNHNALRDQDQSAYDVLRKTCPLVTFDAGGPGYGALARGRLDICLNGWDLEPFDICPLAPIVTGAGGVLTTWDNQAPDIKTHGAIAASASSHLHDQVLNVLNK